MFRFTVAHEIGHWSLHRRKKVVNVAVIEDEESDLEVRYGAKTLKTPRQWMEHQANVFAAALLMPRSTFQKAVIQVQKQLGIATRLGTVFLDNQAVNRQYYKAIVSSLMETYGVSGKATRIRLEETGILDNSHYQGVKSAHQIVIEAMAKKL